MNKIWFCLHLLTLFFFSRFTFSQDFSPKETVKTFDFILDKEVDEFKYVSLARSLAIEGVVASQVKSVSKLESEDKNVDGEIISKQDFSKISEIQTLGVWVKDITPPEITYTKKGKEKWITVKVHGYVAKKPNKTEARELLLKQLSAKPLMEDVQVHSIEYYPNDFIVSIVILDSTSYKSHSVMNRVANILAKRQILTYFQGSQIEDVFIYKTTAEGVMEISKDEQAINTFSAVKESASGWVNAIESLNKSLIKGSSEWFFVFIKEMEE